MAKYIDFPRYSYYHPWTVEAHDSNISYVIDRMLRVATKVTESNASDIIYAVDALKNALRTHTPYHAIIRFREGGVHTYPFDCATEVTEGHLTDRQSGILHDSIQVWELKVSYDNTTGTPHTAFRRVWAVLREK